MRFNFGNFQFELDDPGSFASTHLVEDFADFESSFDHAHLLKKSVNLKVQICDRPITKPPLRPTVRFRCAQIAGLGERRFIQYADGSQVSFDEALGEASIFAPNRERQRELAYLFLLSKLGEAMDFSGAHRVHALGIELGGKRAILIMDQGVGKSTLAVALSQECLRRNIEFKLFSDEIPILKNSRIFSFPIRIALTPHAVTELKIDPETCRKFQRTGYKEKLILRATHVAPLAASGELHFIFNAKRDGRLMESKVESSSGLLTMLSLFKSMVIGWGVPQMAEFFLRLDLRNFLRLSRVALSRFFLAFKLSRSVPSFRFNMTDDPRINAASLVDFFLYDNH
jgi:hypothetical protein